MVIDMKLLYPNYEDSIVNIACSIERYFNIEYKHKTIKDIDNILDKKKPKNVVVILYDGMGYNLINRILEDNSFLRKHLIRAISSVSPSTTTAATTSIRSGLTPMEHGWLGWDLYFKKENKIVTMFTNKYKDTDKDANTYHLGHKYYPYIEIVDKIKENNYAKNILPFGERPYFDLNDMLDRIYYECKKDNKKYLYAYYSNPDSIMHEYGTDSEESIKMFKIINDKTEELYNKIDKDTIIIITADHGHLNNEGILLDNYPEFKNILDKDIWIEGRFCSFSTNNKDKFRELFNKYFSKDFKLYTKEEIIESKIFGIGEEHPLFRDSLGDFIAVGITNKYFRYSDKSVNLKSMHAGITEDEMLVPLIILSKE